MDKINEIFENAKYKKLVKELEIIEEKRIFCKHDMKHFLDVSRIAYIKVLENKLDISKEVIYAIGLLHDIGRVLEYKDGIPHNEGSKLIADEILKETSYTEEEKKIILECINSHRNKEKKDILKIIYDSDKLSRRCFACKAAEECYWEKEKKNNIIKY